MFGQLVEQILEWWHLRGDIERLKQLDDRLLTDMGFERDYIAASARSGLKLTATEAATHPSDLSGPHALVGTAEPAPHRTRDIVLPLRETAACNPG